jgi:predicted nucleotidyltransferase
MTRRQYSIFYPDGSGVHCPVVNYISNLSLDNPDCRLYDYLMETEEIKRFCRENGIEMFVLFGSRTLGKMHPASDIDVAVKFKKGTDISKLELIYRLDDLLDGKHVDLVILTADTDPLLLYEIFFHGKLLYEEHPDIFEREKLRAWKLYIDTEKIREMQRKYLKEFVERVL